MEHSVENVFTNSLVAEWSAPGQPPFRHVRAGITPQRIWVADSTVLRSFEWGEQGIAEGLRIDTGHSEITSIDSDVDVLTAGVDGKCKMWNRVSGKNVLTVESDDGSGFVGCCFASTAIITAGEDHTLRVWDRATGVLRVAVETSGPALLLTRAGWGAVTCERASVALWNLSNGDTSLTKRHVWPVPNTVSALATSPSEYIAVGMIDGGVVILDGQTGKQIQSFSSHKCTVRGVAFTPDMRFVIAGSAQGLQVLDPLSGRHGVVVSADKYGGCAACLSLNRHAMYLHDRQSDTTRIGVFELWPEESE